MIAIIDYGMGNLRSVEKAFAVVGHPAVVTRHPRAIDDASHVVLPGVGAFADCMANLERYELIEPILRTIQKGKPFLGICLGLQLLFTESEEFGVHRGLDVVAGKVTRFASVREQDSGSLESTGLKVPHMGWNALTVTRESPLLHDIDNGAHVYFVHSYYVQPTDPTVACTVTEYGHRFVSSIWRDNVVACQFHPEKSQSIGLRMIRNFGAWS
ncbi:MAG TPA: imidazole glycerol phosphate synthase subunit HisH [Nitrospiraceae bacterium]|nr:imidazole glycerol phosphate synthase subunit HisH [Nitrospiraceae bacterium]